MISVVIPTRGNDKNITRLLNCLERQTKRPQKVYILRDKKLTEKQSKQIINKYQTDQFNLKILTNQNSNLKPNSGVSYLRNIGIKRSSTKFIQFFDDDVIIDKNFLSKSIDLWKKFKKEYKTSKIIITPQVYYRNTNKIQTRGFKYFNFLLSRPIPYKGNKKEYNIQMFSSMSLFGKRKEFQKIKYDESMDFVYEDLDFTYRLYLNKNKIINTKQLSINHFERSKNKLETVWLGSSKDAYRKGKHRIDFVYKNAGLINKICFFGFGLRGHTIWLMLNLGLYDSKKRKIDILKSLLSGTKDGIKNILIK